MKKKINTSKELPKNSNYTFSVVCYFTWKLELDLNVNVLRLIVGYALWIYHICIHKCIYDEPIFWIIFSISKSEFSLRFSVLYMIIIIIIFFIYLSIYFSCCILKDAFQYIGIWRSCNFVLFVFLSIFYVKQSVNTY